MIEVQSQSFTSQNCENLHFFQEDKTLTARISALSVHAHAPWPSQRARERVRTGTIHDTRLYMWLVYR